MGRCSLLVVASWLLVGVLAGPGDATADALADDWRVRGAMAALESGDASLEPLAMRVLADRHATAAFESIVARGRALLIDAEQRGALAYALGTLQVQPAISIPLLLEIFALDDYRVGSEASGACEAFARWRSSGTADVTGLAPRLAPQAGADPQDWYLCIGVWDQAGVDAVLAPQSWNSMRFRLVAAAVVPRQRAEAARKILALLDGPGLTPERRTLLIEGLGYLGHATREVVAYLDHAAEDPKVRNVATAALAKLLPAAPADALGEERLIRWSREASQDALRGPFIARSAKLQAELVASIERESPLTCSRLGTLLSGPSAIPTAIVDAIAAGLASKSEDRRQCARLLGQDVVERAPSLVVPLAEAMRGITGDQPRTALLTALIEAGAVRRVAEDISTFFRGRGAATEAVSAALAGATVDAATAAKLRPAILGYLSARDNVWTASQIGPALLAVGPITTGEALGLIERTYDGLRLNGDAVIALRFWAIVLSGAAPTVVLAARVLAVTNPPLGQLSAPAARASIDAALGVLAFPELRSVGRRARSMVRSVVDDVRWSRADASYLRQLLVQLPASDPALTELRAAVTRRVSEFDPPPRPGLRRVGLWMLATIGVHFPIWLALLLTVYPRSRYVQSAMLFNPLGRAVTGLGYTQLLILASARLRRRLFAPLVDEGRDAEVAAFDVASFYDQIRVAPIRRRKNPQAPVELDAAVPWIQVSDLPGMVVIEGASGLGKTHVQKAMLARGRAAGRTCLFVRASECNGGVVKEIEDRLALRNADRFVESLFHRGAIELFIDGLNEAQPNGVAEIARFCERATHARIVVTTQPMTWACPRRARQFRLLPLEPHEFEAFLLAQWPGVRIGDGAAAGPDAAAYRERVAAFVAERTGAREIAVLQNRIDLAFVAHLLARNEVPNIHSLRKQVVEDAARAYEAAAPGGAFPLAALAAAAMRVLETGHPVITTKDLDPGVLGHLAERKLLLHRGDTDWLFRHDTIACYFAAQGFFAPLVTSDEVDPAVVKKEYLTSPRFVGVYLQLAESLPLHAAHRLAIAIREHGRRSGDRTLEVAFQDVVDHRAE
jgi:hypothetical protein